MDPKNTGADIEYIKTELLPEMVHDRCFCDAASREFVEFQSAEVEPLDPYYISQPPKLSVYRASAIVNFSGEPTTFRLLVKLLATDESSRDFELGFDALLNEEILCNKGSLAYGRGFFPKFYAASMGRYGRPAMVVEDLERGGYERVLDRELSGGEGRLLMELTGRFHGRGFELRERRFSTYNELVAKFQEIVFADSVGEDDGRNYSM